MKLQIDTELKTIKIEREIKFSSLIDTLNALFKNEDWKEYKLIIEQINNFTSPIIVYPNAYPYTNTPWYGDPVYCGTDPVYGGTNNSNPHYGGVQLLNENISTNTIYNIEIQN